MRLFRGDAEVTTEHERARPVTTAPWDAERSTGSSDAPRERASFKTPIVYVGMSGGVDSSVSAVLLKEQGYHVIGAYMKNWSRDLPGMKCPWAEDLADAKRVAVKLGIDFKVFDFEKDYKHKVVDYMLEEFRKGRTPNPDIMCNQEIKFKLFYDVARENGADFIATGHYAQILDFIEQSASRPRPSSPSSRVDGAIAPQQGPQCREADIQQNLALGRAVDDNKDQTYFLYRISQEAINHTLFPIGHMHKSEVKELAAKYGLDNAYKKESMGVCFVGEVGIKDFLKEYIETEPGPIVDADTGKELGYHEGAIFYTIGQRRGLNIGGGLPYYVVSKDMAKNTVYVSQNLNNAELWTKELVLDDIILRKVSFSRSRPSSLSSRVDGAIAPQQGPQYRENELFTRLRHRGPLIPVRLMDNKLIFENLVKRPASGQSAVLYGGPNAEICLGGGIIR